MSLYLPLYPSGTRNGTESLFLCHNKSICQLQAQKLEHTKFATIVTIALSNQQAAQQDNYVHKQAPNTTFSPTKAWQYRRNVSDDLPALAFQENVLVWFLILLSGSAAFDSSSFTVGLPLLTQMSDNSGTAMSSVLIMVPVHSCWWLLSSFSCCADHFWPLPQQLPQHLLDLISCQWCICPFKDCSLHATMRLPTFLLRVVIGAVASEWTQSSGSLAHGFDMSWIPQTLSADLWDSFAMEEVCCGIVWQGIHLVGNWSTSTARCALSVSVLLLVLGAPGCTGANFQDKGWLMRCFRTGRWTQILRLQSSYPLNSQSQAINEIMSNEQLTGWHGNIEGHGDCMIRKTGLNDHCSLVHMHTKWQVVISAWQLSECSHWLIQEVLAQVVPIDDCAEGPCVHFSTEWYVPASMHDDLDSLQEW